MRITLLSACAFAAITISSSAIHAAPCSAYVANSVTNTAGCELGSISQDFLLDPLQVNVDAIFGYNDWNFIARDNAPEGGGFGTSESGDTGVNTDLTLVGGTTGAGTWAIAEALFETYGNLLLVFKGGNGQVIEPGEYVSYLLDGSFFSGNYIRSPFINSNNSNQTGISHISLYGQGEPDDGDDGPSPVPLPAGGVLLLTGLAGLSAAARRRKRK